MASCTMGTRLVLPLNRRVHAVPGRTFRGNVSLKTRVPRVSVVSTHKRSLDRVRCEASVPGSTDAEAVPEMVEMEASLPVSGDVDDENRIFGLPAESEDNEGQLVVMPPFPLEGLLEDCSELEMDELVESDAVYNHELSWTSFNWRVLAMALDSSQPLFERLRFLAITARNLDEFFAKRVGGLKRQEAAGVSNLVRRRRSYNWTPARQLELLTASVAEFVERQTETLMDDLLPALRAQGVFLYNYYELQDEERASLREYFISELEPLLTPLAVDPGHPFPYLTSLALNLAIQLRDPEDPDYEDTEKKSLAIVTLPTRGLQRWVKIGENKFVPLEHVVIYNLDRLFGGMEIQAVHCFRATRNADVERNEDEAEDLLEMMTDEVRTRRFAPFVRLEANGNMDEDLVATLVREMSLTMNDVYFMKGPLGIGDLFDLPVDFGLDTSLVFPHWAPMTHLRLAKMKSKTEIFKQIRRGDILVQHPYQSFATSTQMLVEAAACDPKVVAIKCTLYRTSNNSPIVNALIAAAENGVQVAVLVELKARFDEARNVSFAHTLEDAGCNVAYGLVGLKTHCKCTLVIRQEDALLRPYCHIGTGNYNPATASVYTDYGLLTCDPGLGADVMDLFKYLTGYHRQQSFRKLLVAPTTMRAQYLRLIDQEIRHASQGQHAEITCKVNGIDDPVLTTKLYEASQAGVQINLIVRGICRVRPGIPGRSDNIRVVSIIGRFLEHHRIVKFHNNNEPLYFIGSADWMTRNLMRRVEVATPIEDPLLQRELDLCLQAALKDTTAWHMQPNGSMSKLVKPQASADIPPLASQDDLPARATLVGMQEAMMQSYKLQRRKHSNKARRATQAVRRKGKLSARDNYFTRMVDSELQAVNTMRSTASMDEEENSWGTTTYDDTN